MIFNNSIPTWNALACGEATTLNPKAKRLIELERVLSSYVSACWFNSTTMIVYFMLRNCQSLVILIKGIIISIVLDGIRWWWKIMCLTLCGKHHHHHQHQQQQQPQQQQHSRGIGNLDTGSSTDHKPEVTGFLMPTGWLVMHMAAWIESSADWSSLRGQTWPWRSLMFFSQGLKGFAIGTIMSRTTGLMESRMEFQRHSNVNAHRLYLDRGIWVKWKHHVLTITTTIEIVAIVTIVTTMCHHYSSIIVGGTTFFTMGSHYIVIIILSYYQPLVSTIVTIFC